MPVARFQAYYTSLSPMKHIVTLRLARRTVLRGTVKEGKLTAWDIQPSSRRKDVVVRQPQPRKGNACEAFCDRDWTKEW